MIPSEWHERHPGVVRADSFGQRRVPSNHGLVIALDKRFHRGFAHRRDHHSINVRRSTAPHNVDEHRTADRDVGPIIQLRLQRAPDLMYASVDPFSHEDQHTAKVV